MDPGDAVDTQRTIATDNVSIRAPIWRIFKSPWDSGGNQLPGWAEPW
jgi:hypothetical protein